MKTKRCPAHVRFFSISALPPGKVTGKVYVECGEVRKYLPVSGCTDEYIMVRVGSGAYFWASSNLTNKVKIQLLNSTVTSFLKDVERIFRLARKHPGLAGAEVLLYNTNPSVWSPLLDAHYSEKTGRESAAVPIDFQWSNKRLLTQLTQLQV